MNPSTVLLHPPQSISDSCPPLPPLIPFSPFPVAWSGAISLSLPAWFSLPAPRLGSFSHSTEPWAPPSPEAQPHPAPVLSPGLVIRPDYCGPRTCHSGLEAERRPPRHHHSPHAVHTESPAPQSAASLTWLRVASAVIQVSWPRPAEPAGCATRLRPAKAGWDATAVQRSGTRSVARQRAARRLRPGSSQPPRPALRRVVQPSLRLRLWNPPAPWPGLRACTLAKRPYCSRWRRHWSQGAPWPEATSTASFGPPHLTAYRHSYSYSI